MHWNQGLDVTVCSCESVSVQVSFVQLESVLVLLLHSCEGGDRVVEGGHDRGAGTWQSYCCD